MRLQLEIDREETARFESIKKRMGAKTNSEVLRRLINETHEVFFGLNCTSRNRSAK